MVLEVLQGAQDEPITQEELFKLQLAIDAELLNEAHERGLDIPYKDDARQAAEALREIITSDLTDGLQGVGEIDFDTLSTLSGVDGLGLFKKAIRSVKNTVNKVTDTARNVAQKVIPKPIYKALDKVSNTAGQIATKAVAAAATVAKAAHKVIALPMRGAILGMLKVLGGKAAPAFLYAFIPNNHPILSVNNVVKGKRDSALKAIDIISKTNAFNNGTVLKHLRNGFVKKYKKSPEDVLNAMFKGQLNGLGFDFGAIAAAVVALAPAIPAIVKVFGKKEAPAPNDIKPNDPDNEIKDPLTNDDGGGDGKKKTRTDDDEENKFLAFITSPLGIVLGITVIGGLVTGIVFIVRGSKNKPKRRRR